HAEMARVPPPANVAPLLAPERKAREDRHAVIALLPAHGDMRKAERAQFARREIAVDAFDLLQAEHVGLLRAHEARHEIEPEPDRIDVPGGEAEAHGGGQNRRGRRRAQAPGARSSPCCTACGWRPRDKEEAPE